MSLVAASATSPLGRAPHRPGGASSMPDKRVCDLRLSVLLSPFPEEANGFPDAWPVITPLLPSFRGQVR
jgi:hypothetical protein